MSNPTPRGKLGIPWQYHSRSDLHSKVACWTVLVDLLQSSAVLQQHVRDGKLILGVNHSLRVFATGRKKKLDLVIARPDSGAVVSSRSLLDLAAKYSILLSARERRMVGALPVLREGVVGSVLVALEAKAAMTAHSKALPRLYDELTSSYETVHGSTSRALSVGLAMVNVAKTFVSPGRQEGASRVVSSHNQPDDAQSVLEKLGELPRRTSEQGRGFDGLAVIVVECANDGSPIQLVTGFPAPPIGDVLNYSSMIARVAAEYDSRFRSI